MKRREFITLIGSSAAAWPIATRAQRSVTATIGFLHVASAKPFGAVVEAFRQGLKETGYTEGRNLRIEFRWADGDYSRLRQLAAELVSVPVTVLVTGGGEASALAAKGATSTIPIVCNMGEDPVKLGLVASMSRPGGNVTGVNILTAELAAKRIGLLHDLVPSASIIGHIVNPNFPPTATNIQEVEAAAHVLRLKIVLAKARTREEIDSAFASIRAKGAGGLLVGSDPFFNSLRDRFVALAARDGLPAIFEQKDFAVAGGLMSYGTSLTDAYRLMGTYAGRILNGAKPGDLPVVQSAKFELVINLKTAKALGLTIPSGLLSAADEVIQ